MATFFAAPRRPAWGRRPRQPPGETGPPGLAPADDFQGRRVPPRRAGDFPGFARRATYFLCGQKVGKEPPGVGRGWLSAQRAGLGQSACTPGPPRRRKVRLVSFPPAAKTAPASLLLLSPQNPLRWAFVGTPDGQLARLRAEKSSGQSPPCSVSANRAAKTPPASLPLLSPRKPTCWVCAGTRQIATHMSRQKTDFTLFAPAGAHSARLYPLLFFRPYCLKITITIIFFGGMIC